MRKLLKTAMPVLLACSLILTSCAATAEQTTTTVKEILSTTEDNVGGKGNTDNTAATTATATAATTNPDAELYSDRDWDASYDGAKTIDCTGSTDISITAAGVYLLTGTLNGSVIVEAGDTDKVQLVLDNLTVTSPDGPAIWVKNADKVFLTLPEGSVSTLSDSATYTMLDDDEEPNACVYVDCDLTIQGSGTLNVTGNYKHAIRSKDDLTITGGVLNLSGVNKGLKAKTTCAIGGGVITVSASKEGVEANDIILTGGILDVTATDDGINASSPTNWTGEAPTIQIRGGTVLVNAMGDGVDSNGTLTMSDGVLLVSGPTSSGDGAIDYETSGTITGGIVIAAGSAGMAEGFGSNSTQASWMTNLTESQSGGTSITLVDADGNVLAHWTPAKDYQNVVVSAPAMAVDGSYTILTGATVDGTDTYGFVSSGTATGGIEAATTTLTSLTQNDGGGMGGGFGGGKGGGMRGEMSGDRTLPDGTTMTPPDGAGTTAPDGEGMTKPDGMTRPDATAGATPSTDSTSGASST